MSRESERPGNLCMACPITDFMPCPLAERAYRRGYDGMRECEMWDVVRRVVANVKETARCGPKTGEK